MTKIANIIVGERRREDLGDIAALAESIERFGLLHPIVIDWDNNLIAGGRRLAAAVSLGWEEIDTRQLGELTEAERRELELEENIRRKDLTEYERSRALTALADLAREMAKSEPLTRTNLVQVEAEKHGPAPTPGSLRDVAGRIGVPVPNIQRAAAHVAAVERYPVLEPLPQSTAIDTASTLDNMPEPVRDQVIASIEAAAPEDRRRVAREQAAPLNIDAVIALVDKGGAYADQRLRSAWADMAHHITRELLHLNPERVAEVLDTGAWASFERTATEASAWFEQVRAARARGLRIVGGSK